VSVCFLSASKPFQNKLNIPVKTQFILPQFYKTA
jgi:hypothetical protein